MINIQYNVTVVSSIKKEKRKNKNTPAETSVAEWINAEAGTGASIESGNQIWKPNCADLINADSIKKKVKNSTYVMVKFKIVTWKSNIFEYNIFNVKIFDSPNVTKFKIIKIKIPKSLILLNKNALNAAFNVLIFVDQKLIKKNEVRPINSHPKNKTNRLPPKTSIHILIINKLINKNNRSTWGSYLK